MKDTSTHLAIVVDRSGSMAAIREDAEGGLKTFIDEQRALPGELSIELFQFDTHYEKVDDIDAWRLVPRGATALLDALGKAIAEVGEGLAARPEEERPAKVVFLVVTDGLENSSQEWTREKVFESVKRQTDDYAWEFVFTAANQDAIAEGAKLGMANSMNHTATGAGVQSAYATMSQSVGAYRGGQTSGVEVPEDAPES
jgi:Mg-chelatase subunit ChlD